MSTDEPKKGRTNVQQSYRGQSRVDDDGVRLVSDLRRTAVRVRGTVKDPVAVREALSVLHEIVRSDLRYKPKDRTAYAAYQSMKKRSAGMAQLQAQQAYFDWLARNDPMAWFVLDPVVSVSEDGVSFEVFSKDEGTWAHLHIARSAIVSEGDWVTGTTNIDFSDALFDGIQRVRSYRPLQLAIGPDAVVVTAGSDKEVVEKRVQLPDSWLRGFLQVQSSATLARAVVHLSAIDAYNLLRHLRLNADVKKKGRAVRVELVPGETPRLVLEPWETVIEADRPYAGRKPEVVRIWGRRRWSLARRLMPFVESAELHVIGSGLPSFLVLRAGDITLTLGLTGFTAANWSKTMQFDTLLPRPSKDRDKLQIAVLKQLGKAPASLDDLVKTTKSEAADVLAELQAACQNGLVMVDLAANAYRLRPLLIEDPDPDSLRYRNDNERVAWDLLAAKAVKLTKEERSHGVGTELVATVAVAADKREYRTSFTLDDEGRVRSGQCTCHAFRTHGLKEGPCSHLLALRLRYADLQNTRASKREARGAITTETRTYSRRTDAGDAVTQLSLNKSRLVVRWGLRSEARLRVQNLVFNTLDDARADYYARIDALESRGFLDASAS